jgi:hypothetical protein
MEHVKSWLEDKKAEVIVGILAILAGAFVAYHIFFMDRDVKSLRVEILAAEPMLKEDKSVTDQIKFFYQDQPIDNLSLVQIKLEHDGNKAIREEDFSKPITFTFPLQAEVIEAAVLESDPSDIGIELQKTQNIVSFSPVLLNGGDRAIIRFLVIIV